jgi:hypothetical protein
VKKRPLSSEYARRRIRELDKIIDNCQDIMHRLDDCALFAKAVCQDVARWEFFSGDRQRGEVCVGGMRHATSLNEYGCPRLHDHLRHALRKAIASHLERTIQ